MVALILVFGGLPRAWAAADGIFADFTTSMGSFTCRLDHAVAPRAVANFIGLVTGERAWLDGSSGLARTNAFFEGVTFHRVITNFMIQSGSRNGLGTDGPGYVFVDEFSSSSRFNAAGKLAMANSGPDSNGSQFFITVAPTPWLNDVHTIFGSVVGGSNVVHAISSVATEGANKPKTNVVIQHVGIRRVGSAAQNFKVHAQNLPIVTNLPLNLLVKTGAVSLAFTNRQYAGSRLFVSTNLNHWSDQPLGIELTAPTTNCVWRTNAAPLEFYRLARVQYAASTLAPKTLNDRLLTLRLDGGTTVIKITFNSTGGGTYTFSNSAGFVTMYEWEQEPYRGYINYIYFTGIIPMSMRLDFTSATGGNFRGTAYPPDGLPFSNSGTFTLQ